MFHTMGYYLTPCLQTLRLLEGDDRPPWYVTLANNRVSLRSDALGLKVLLDAGDRLWSHELASG